jgi:hypothetical protein
MANENESTEISSKGSYHLEARGQDMTQASVTYKVTPSGNRPLGRGGEMFGIGKTDLDQTYQTMLKDQHEANEKEDLERVQQLSTKENNLISTVHSTAALFPNYSFHEDAVERNARQSNLLSRAVASSKVDDLLGMKVLAQEKFGVQENNQVVGISVGVDGVSATGKLSTGQNYRLDIDYSNPEIQKGLYDLEALDYITGQVDRHAGNIFIDPQTNKVRGIDNDLAFPRQSREAIVAHKSRDYNNKLVGTMPQYMHVETARKIEQLRPEDLRKTLAEIKYPGKENRGQLHADEIEGAVKRLKDLQKEIKQMRKEGRVVDQFNNDTYQQAILNQNRSVDSAIQSNLAGKKNPSQEQIKYATSIELADSKKTSYLGTIEVEKRKIQADGGLSLKPEHLAQHGISTKIPRSPQVEEFEKLAQPQRQHYQQQVATKFSPDIEKLKEQIRGYEERLGQLRGENMNGSKFKALRYGGVERATAKFEQKLQEAQYKMGDLNRKMGQEVDRRMDEVSDKLWTKALKNVPLEKKLGAEYELPEPELVEKLPKNLLDGVNVIERQPSRLRSGSVGDILELEKQKKTSVSRNKLGKDSDTLSVKETTGIKTGEETPKRKLARSNTLN